MKFILPVFVLALILGFTSYRYLNQYEPNNITTYPNPKTLSDFQLTDHQGNSFSLIDFKNKWSIVFFGFTFCPDICPTTLAELAQIADKLSEESLQNIQFIFVSVDPERDTIVKLAEYVPFFHSDFLGVTAQEPELKNFAFDLGAVYMKVPEGDSYQMSHSSSIFVINPEGQRYGILKRNERGFLDINGITTDLEMLQ